MNWLVSIKTHDSENPDLQDQIHTEQIHAANQVSAAHAMLAATDLSGLTRTTELILLVSDSAATDTGDKPPYYVFIREGDREHSYAIDQEGGKTRPLTDQEWETQGECYAHQPQVTVLIDDSGTPPHSST